MPPRRRPPARPPAEQPANPLFLPGLDDSSSSSDEEAAATSTHTPPPPPTQTSIPPRPTTPIPVPIHSAPPDYGSSSSSSPPTRPTSPTDPDPVIHTYPIHITPVPAPQHHLHLLQYPLRPKHRPYTRAQKACPVEARFKPRAGLLEVDIPVNVGVNYDREKGRVWGDVVRKEAAREIGKWAGGGGGKKRKVVGGGEEGEREEEEEEDVMYMEFEEAAKAGRVLNKQTLGGRVVADGTKYMVGVFKNGKLYLTPISSTLQLRPQFHHVDTQLDQERAATKALRDPPQKPEARAVQLSVKNVEDPSSQMSATMKALRIAEEEAWTRLHWVDQDTDDAWEVYASVCLKEEEEGARLRCVTSRKEYIEWLAAGRPIVKVEKEKGVGVKREG